MSQNVNPRKSFTYWSVKDFSSFRVVFEVTRPSLLSAETVTVRSPLSRVLHLDVEVRSEELLHQISYAIKNQLGHPKPPTRGFGTQRPNG